MKQLLIVYMATAALSARAQIGGQRIFESLNTPASALDAALGGILVSSPVEDPSVALSNPALLRPEVEGVLGLTYQNFVADIQYVTAVYAFGLKKLGTFHGGIRYLDYGTFEGFDDAGAPGPSFSARDVEVLVGHARKAGNFRYGANLKIASSSVSGFNASALLFDLGGAFVHPTRELTVGLAIKNVGFLFSDFSETSSSELPFDVQVGATFKPRYMPFRFSLTTYNLWRGDIAFFDPSLSDDEPGVADKIFRHVALGTEALISKNIHARIGYNHLIRKELRLEERSGGAGFSFGFMLKVKAFDLAYTRSLYHVAGGNNFITVNTNLKRLFPRQATKAGDLNGKTSE